MGFWSSVKEWWNTPLFERELGETFQITESDIPAQIFGLESYQDPIAPAPRVSRREAIQVPAVKRGRDLVAGTIGQIPFRVLDTMNVEHVSTLLAQPEVHRARSITMTQTVEDMLFEQQAWWWIRQFDWRGFPARVTMLPPDSEFDDERGVMRIALKDGGEREIPAKELIKFDSPTDGVLIAGARAIRTYLKLVAAADRQADEPMPSGYFAPTPEADPSEVDIQGILDDWQAARQKRSTAYVPGPLKYETLQWSPEQLQMDAARQHAVLEIARIFGIDSEDLQVSTTTRTYVNAQDRRIAMINDTLGMYVRAVEERLSMPDVTPRGYRVAADFNGFLRADDKTRFETYQVGVELGIWDRDGIAAREGLPQPTFPEPQRTPTAAIGTGND